MRAAAVDSVEQRQELTASAIYPIWRNLAEERTALEAPCSASKITVPMLSF